MMLQQVVHLALPGAAIVCRMMLVLWIIHLLIRNAAIADVGWAADLGLLGIFCAYAGPGYSAHHWAIAGHGLFQRTASPAISGLVLCRFRPTCSHYSEEAVHKYGIAKGLRLNLSRLWRCRASAPLRTSDPVP